jgi:hypothetical protein
LLIWLIARFAGPSTVVVVYRLSVRTRSLIDSSPVASASINIVPNDAPSATVTKNAGKIVALGAIVKPEYVVFAVIPPAGPDIVENERATVTFSSPVLPVF